MLDPNINYTFTNILHSSLYHEINMISTYHHVALLVFGSKDWFGPILDSALLRKITYSDLWKFSKRGHKI